MKCLVEGAPMTQEHRGFIFEFSRLRRNLRRKVGCWPSCRPKKLENIFSKDLKTFLAVSRRDLVFQIIIFLIRDHLYRLGIDHEMCASKISFPATEYGQSFSLISVRKSAEAKIPVSKLESAWINMQNGDFESRFRANSLFHVRHIASRPVRACRECFIPIRVLVNCRSALRDLSSRRVSMVLEGFGRCWKVWKVLEAFRRLWKRFDDFGKVWKLAWEESMPSTSLRGRAARQAYASGFHHALHAIWAVCDVRVLDKTGFSLRECNGAFLSNFGLGVMWDEIFSVKFGFSAKKYADSWFRIPIPCGFIVPCPSHCIAMTSCMRRVLRTHPCAGEPQVSTRRSKLATTSTTWSEKPIIRKIFLDSLIFLRWDTFSILLRHFVASLGKPFVGWTT